MWIDMKGYGKIILICAVLLLLAGCAETNESTDLADPATSFDTREDRTQSEQDTLNEPNTPDEPAGQALSMPDPEDSGETRVTDTTPAYSEALTDALMWERIKANYMTGFLWLKGKTFRQLGDEPEAMYCWISGKGEAAYRNLTRLSILLFSGPILSEDSKCVAVAYDFKYAAPDWNRETSFSKDIVLKAGGDVKWVERKGKETAYLEYTFDGLQTRVYTNDYGTEILSDRNVLLKEESVEEMFGLRDLNIDEGLIVNEYARNGEERVPIYDYIECFGRTQEEITEMLPGNYKFNVYGSMRELNDNIEYSFIDGFCSHVNVPVGVAFPDLGNGAGVDYIKKLNMPFTYRLTSPESTYYIIKFEKFDVFITADSDANIVKDEKVAIQFNGKY
jgi:hypothetical protein